MRLTSAPAFVSHESSPRAPRASSMVTQLRTAALGSALLLAACAADEPNTRHNYGDATLRDAEPIEPDSKVADAMADIQDFHFAPSDVGSQPDVPLNDGSVDPACEQGTIECDMGNPDAGTHADAAPDLGSQPDINQHDAAIPDAAPDAQLPDASIACEVGLGECRNFGILVDGVCSAEPFPASTDICDGLDNNCDGIIDNDCAIGRACTIGVGVCEVRGLWQLDPNNIGERYCHTQQVAEQPSPEICDGIDNDCDGQTDEEIPEGDECVGACNDLRGHMICFNGGLKCDAPEPGIEADSPCDGLDNDCDGIIDNGQPCPTDIPCEVGVGSCKNHGVLLANGQCSAEPLPAATDICDGFDNNCDGIPDNDCRIGAQCTVGPEACPVIGHVELDPINIGETLCDVDGQPIPDVCP